MRRFLIVTIAGVLLFTSAAIVYAGNSTPTPPLKLGPNLILNPSMEKDGTYGMPLDWLRPDPNAINNVGRSNVRAYDGIYSLQFQGVDMPNGTNMQADTIPFELEPNSRYQLDFEVYVEGDPGLYAVYDVDYPPHSYRGAFNYKDGGQYFPVPASGQWFHMSGNLDLVASTTPVMWRLAFALEKIYSLSEEPNMYIDNVQLRKILTPETH